jgi:hypothetical protein
MSGDDFARFWDDLIRQDDSGQALHPDKRDQKGPAPKDKPLP